MANNRRSGNTKLLAKKAAKKKVTLKAKVLRKRADLKKAAISPANEIPVLIASEVKIPHRDSPMLVWATMPLAIINMWLSPFERRT